MPRVARDSLLAVAVANGGLRKGMRGAQFAMEWAIVAADGVSYEGGVTEQMRQYLDWWSPQINERTAWRRLQDFRESFPGEDSPARLAAMLAPQWVEPLERMRELAGPSKRKAATALLAQGLSSPVPV